MNGENYLHYKLNLEFYHLIFPNGLDGSPRVPLGPFTGTPNSYIYKDKVVAQNPDRIMEYLVRSNMGYAVHNPFKDHNFLIYTYNRTEDDVTALNKIWDVVRGSVGRCGGQRRRIRRQDAARQRLN